MRNFALKNYQSVLLEIFLNQGIRRFELSDKLSMAPASVTKYCAMLIKKHIVIEDNLNKERNVSLSLNPRWKRMLGIDIGGYQMRVGILEANGTFSLIDEFPTPDNPAILKSVISKYSITTDGVGIGVTGVIDERGKTLDIFPNKRSWDRYSFEDIKAGNLFVTTSGRAAAVHEKNFGVLKNYINAMHINFGFGIQSSLYINGEAVSGDTNAAGEFGHVYSSAIAGRCTCGNYGCLENVATVPMIINKIVSKAAQPSAAGMLAEKYQKSLSTISSDDIRDAFSKGDSSVLAEVNVTAEAIALALSGIVNVVNPSAISIGGFLPVLFPGIHRIVYERLKSKALDANYRKLAVLESVSPIYGACAGAALIPLLNSIKMVND